MEFGRGGGGAPSFANPSFGGGQQNDASGDLKGSEFSFKQSAPESYHAPPANPRKPSEAKVPDFLAGSGAGESGYQPAGQTNTYNNDYNQGYDNYNQYGNNQQQDYGYEHN